MDDFSFQVRQIAQYPLIDALGPDDVLVVQLGGLNGPFRSIKQGGLWRNAVGMSIGLFPPLDARGLQSSFVTTPLGARQGYNFYVDGNGIQRYLENSDVAGQWSFADTELSFSIAPLGVKDQPIPCFQKLFALGFDGVGTFYEQVRVGRDPIIDTEVATRHFVEHATVTAFNGRRGDVMLSAADLNAALGLKPPDQVASQSWVWAEICRAIDALYNSQPFVYTFNGRVGDICLLASDITVALTVPGVYAFANTPALGDASGKLATTLFVDESLDALYQQIQHDISGIIDLSAYAKLASPQFTGIPTAPTANPGTTTGQLATTAFVQAAVAAATAGVSSFNTRTGAVVLNLGDITTAGGAPLASPTFTGTPAGPTAAPGTNTTELATTAFVHAAVAAISVGVSSFNTRTGAVTLVTADITGAGGAPIASPALTGTPTAPTPATADSSTTLATTAFVHAAIAALGTGVASFNSRTGAVTLLAADVSAAGGALVASPIFTGVPAAPTAAPGTSSTQLATTAFVQAAITASAAGVTSFNGRTGVVTLTTADVTGAGGAPIASPVFSGTPAAPTVAAADSSTTLATTAFVHSAIAATSLVSSFNTRTGAITLIGADVSAAGGALIASPTFTGTPAAPTATPGTNTTQLATCAFVTAALSGSVASFNGRTGVVVLTAADLTAAGGALLASPAFSGTPTTPTPAAGTNNTQVASTAFVQGALGTVGGFTTGDLKMTWKTVADAGWLLLDDTTFGSASSGANHADNATQALFTLLFGNMTDANAPLLTSTGAATTRAAQGTATAAWTANCRMALPLTLGRALAVAGTGSGLSGRTLGNAIGGESVTQDTNALAQHAHTPVPGFYFMIYGAAGTGFYGGSNSFGNYATTANFGNSTPMNNMQPTTFYNVMIKL